MNPRRDGVGHITRGPFARHALFAINDRIAAHSLRPSGRRARDEGDTDGDAQVPRRHGGHGSAGAPPAIVHRYSQPHIDLQANIHAACGIFSFAKCLFILLPDKGKELVAGDEFDLAPLTGAGDSTDTSPERSVKPATR